MKTEIIKWIDGIKSILIILIFGIVFILIIFLFYNYAPIIDTHCICEHNIIFTHTSLNCLKHFQDCCNEFCLNEGFGNGKACLGLDFDCQFGNSTDKKEID